MENALIKILWDFVFSIQIYMHIRIFFTLSSSLLILFNNLIITIKLKWTSNLNKKLVSYGNKFITH